MTWFAVFLYFSLAGDPMHFEKGAQQFNAKEDCLIAANIRAGQLDEPTLVIVPICVLLAKK